MAKPEMIEMVKQLLTKYLRKQNLRKTPERFRILEHVYQEDGHFDVDTLYKKLKENGFVVSKATVYNTLELFLHAGLVRKHLFSPQTAYYEKKFFTGSHDHLIILDEEGQVKKIVEFCDPRIEAIRKDLEEITGLPIEEHDLYFYATDKTQ